MNPSGKERPILFSAPMVRALLAGTKTQTRRVVKTQPTRMADGLPYGDGPAWAHAEPGSALMRCPYGKRGDRLWVRETHLNWWNNIEPKTFSHVAAYAADGYQLRPGEKWIPSIHMLRAASRITLEVTGVRVERLQEISEADAHAEGLACEWFGMQRMWNVDGGPWHASPVGAYAALWESINGPCSWEANPWVWVVEFKRVEP